jgi:hypothetical protein
MITDSVNVHASTQMAGVESCIESKLRLEEGEEVGATQLARGAEAVEEPELCPVCLLGLDEDEPEVREGEEGESWATCTLACSHSFHEACVFGWAAKCASMRLAATCPSCRAPIGHDA